MAGGGCGRVASELVCVRRAGTLPRSHTAVYIPTSLPAHISLSAVSPRAEPVPVSAYVGRSKNLGSFGGRAHHRVRVLRHTSFRERDFHRYSGRYILSAFCAASQFIRRGRVSPSLVQVPLA